MTEFHIPCPTCGHGVMRLEETMREAQHADGEPLIYFRCVNCGSIFSRLTSKPTVILAGAH